MESCANLAEELVPINIIINFIGTSNFVNKKRIFHIPESFYEEEERQK